MKFLVAHAFIWIAIIRFHSQVLQQNDLLFPMFHRYDETETREILDDSNDSKRFRKHDLKGRLWHLNLHKNYWDWLETSYWMGEMLFQVLGFICSQCSSTVSLMSDFVLWKNCRTEHLHGISSSVHLSYAEQMRATAPKILVYNLGDCTSLDHHIQKINCFLFPHRIVWVISTAVMM